VLGQRHGRAVGQQGEVETVQQARSVALVVQEVRQGRERDAARPARVAPDPQHRLLGHHAAREERGGRLPEHLGEPALERRDRAVLPIAVPLVRVRQGGCHVGEVPQLRLGCDRRSPDE
jgi:hypothetical protein